MKLSDAQKFKKEKSTTGKIEHEKKSLFAVEPYHSVIVRSDVARNTGPVQVFLDNHDVKYGHLIQWLTKPQNQKYQIVKIVTVEAK